MIKRIGIILVLFFAIGCKFSDAPLVFSEDALADRFFSLNGEEITLGSVLEKNKEKTIVIDIWASWCKDCLLGMPRLKQLQKNYPEVSFLFLSLDRNETKWKKGIKKHKLQGDHYYIQSGMNGPLGNFLDLDWIPRYMVINKKREIKIFKAINAGDIYIKKLLDQIK